MARMKPDELEEQRKKQEDLYESQYPEENEDPVDLDESYKETMGNDLPDDEGLDIAEEVEEDEEAVLEKPINDYEEDENDEGEKPLNEEDL